MKRFSNRVFEHKHFHFGDVVIEGRVPDVDDIRTIITSAMKHFHLKGDRLSEENAQTIYLYFSQFLPIGEKRIKRKNDPGNLGLIKTQDMDRTSIRVSELDKDTIVFKTPQNFVRVSFNPEKLFVYKLIENFKYVDAWIKSRDMGFYSIEYEYFRKGKDRVRSSFNPDFFLKINLNNYINLLMEKGIESQEVCLLQDKGIDTIIRVVEIKSDDDDNEATPAKKRYAEEHFSVLNEKLMGGSNLPAEILKESDSAHQLYIFDLLIPSQFESWFSRLRRGEDDRIFKFLKEDDKREYA